MGCDGGTIPRRDELVRLKKKPEQKDKVAEIQAKWKNCALTQEPLVNPFICCELGRLFNKESIIEYLLHKESGPEISRHIRNLKDVVELKLTENSDFRGNMPEKGDRYIDRQAAKYICPVVGLEMNGMHKFYVLWKCGCVLSERAVKTVKSDVCHKCGNTFSADDFVIINPSDEELEVNRTKMEKRRELLKLQKKAKKMINGKRANEESSNKSDAACKMKKMDEKLKSNDKLKGEGSKTKVKSDMDDHLRKIKPSYSIAKDPNASESLKSLFTSHRTALNKGSAHWVTYNPFYN